MNRAGAERTYVVLGAMIRQRRNAAGMTQNELAVDLGFDKRHLGRIESGFKPVSVVRLLQICDAMGADPGRLISELKERLDYEG